MQCRLIDARTYYRNAKMDFSGCYCIAGKFGEHLYSATTVKSDKGTGFQVFKVFMAL